MTTNNNGGLEIKMAFFPLAFILFMCTPRITINQFEDRRYWGTHFFEMPPGRYRVTISFPYLFMSYCGEN